MILESAETEYVSELIISNVYSGEKLYSDISGLNSILAVFLSMKFTPKFSSEHVLLSLEDVCRTVNNQG